MYKIINPCITEGSFIGGLKVAEVPPSHKNVGRADKSNFDQLLLFLMFQKYMKDLRKVNYTITFIRIFIQNTNVVFVKALVLGMPL